MQFAFQDGEVVVQNEEHYKLVEADKISPEDLRAYKEASDAAADSPKPVTAIAKKTLNFKRHSNQ